MKWFRSNIRQGARLALAALAVQLVLPFGAAQAAPAIRGGGQHTSDNCVICSVGAMAGMVLFAAPPLLKLPEAVEFLYRTTDAEFVHLKSAGVAVQPRASPAS
jgi:hypothetical protein